MSIDINEMYQDALQRVHMHINTSCIALSFEIKEEFWKLDKDSYSTKLCFERREALTGWAKFAQLYDLSIQERTRLMEQNTKLKEQNELLRKNNTP